MIVMKYKEVAAKIEALKEKAAHLRLAAEAADKDAEAADKELEEFSLTTDDMEVIVPEPEAAPETPEAAPETPEPAPEPKTKAAPKAAPKAAQAAAKPKATVKGTAEVAKAPKDDEGGKPVTVTAQSRKNASEGRDAIARGTRPPLKKAMVDVMGDDILNAKGVVEALGAKGWLPSSNDPHQYISYMLSSNHPKVFERTDKRGYYRVRPGYLASQGNKGKKAPKAKAAPKVAKTKVKTKAAPKKKVAKTKVKTKGKVKAKAAPKKKVAKGKAKAAPKAAAPKANPELDAKLQGHFGSDIVSANVDSNPFEMMPQP
jgi:outer membrane biosynthesis protein TonB